MVKIASLLAACLLPGLAGAQGVPFERLADVLDDGDAVRIVEWSGRVVSGHVAGLEPDAITLASAGAPAPRVARADIREISARRRDPVGNGALIGFAAVAVPYCGLGLSRGLSRACGVPAVLVGGLGAALGTAIDAAITRRVVVFRAGARPVAALAWPTRGGMAAAARVAW